ncbi:winged helix-turn-helix transcriptional regulator [Leptospira brenneri]|uniref:Transcriptional regulator n=1 Tax=Leptospira brenneri TaxID=2023182 RepID=A0A2M9Y600_9LEPT|nr:helix-turn-helix domain-containing protein [Leptospira brenneri]PJZ46998.1 hypothetical protein CH361_01210 [Leptospira brenneri]TGK96047.1 transcriptional regulator [Leptospira brenneri]
MKNHENCSQFWDILSLIGDKWVVATIGILSDGPQRYNEIKRQIGDVSQRMLTRTLRRLENRGLITRRILNTIPIGVEYKLTPIGRTLVKPLDSLFEWAIKNADKIESITKEEE